MAAGHTSTKACSAPGPATTAIIADVSRSGFAPRDRHQAAHEESTMFRSKADQIIDRAHSRIANAEMLLAHSFKDGDIQAANDELFAAQRFLRRACDAKRAWQATDHDDYEDYPDVAEEDQYQLIRQP